MAAATYAGTAEKQSIATSRLTILLPLTAVTVALFAVDGQGIQ
jgi:hypothetical protein